MIYFQESNFDFGLNKYLILFSKPIESTQFDKQIDSIKQIWDSVELQTNYKRIGCRWFFKIKHDLTRNIKRYKVRLVAKGNTQKRGIDYKETFSPVSKKDSLRINFSVVSHYDLELHKMDMKTIFLSRSIGVKFYINQRKGF